jgi:hypothetical protein
VSKVLAKSIILIESPVKGEAGKVIVAAPPEVFTKYRSFAAIFNPVEPSAVNVCQGLPPPKPVHCEPL